jgi:DnaJ-class molecular chaperone
MDFQGLVTPDALKLAAHEENKLCPLCKGTGYQPDRGKAWCGTCPACEGDGLKRQKYHPLIKTLIKDETRSK